MSEKESIRFEEDCVRMRYLDLACREVYACGINPSNSNSDAIFKWNPVLTRYTFSYFPKDKTAKSEFV